MRRALLSGCAAFAAQLVLAASAAAAERYECQLTDGSTAILPYDASAQFGGAVAKCVPLEARAAAVEPLPLRPLPAADDAVPGWRGEGRGAASLMPSPYARLIRDAAQRYRIDTRLLMAIAQVESRHSADARSHKGALGLMQVMPETGVRYGVANVRNLFDPEVNLDVSAHYLSDLLDMFDGRVDLAVAAYNAGEGAVTRSGNRIPPFPETRKYVRRVLLLAGRAPR